MRRAVDRRRGKRVSYRVSSRVSESRWVPARLSAALKHAATGEPACPVPPTHSNNPSWIYPRTLFRNRVPKYLLMRLLFSTLRSLASSLPLNACHSGNLVVLMRRSNIASLRRLCTESIWTDLESVQYEPFLKCYRTYFNLEKNRCGFGKCKSFEESCCFSALTESYESTVEFVSDLNRSGIVPMRFVSSNVQVFYLFYYLVEKDQTWN